MDYNNYLLKKINEKEKINMCLMSHNVEWYNFKRLSAYYDNININIMGTKSYRLSIFPYDLIISYDNDYFDEEHLEELNKVASQIAIKYNKQVTVGYQYFLPFNERIFENCAMNTIIKKFAENGQIVYEKEELCSAYSSAMGLANKTCYAHYSNLERKLER